MSPSEEPNGYGSWMALSQEDWLKIAVVNQIDYTVRHLPVAGCGFLLEVGNEVVAATAKHVLTYFKSVEMDAVDLNGTSLGHLSTGADLVSGRSMLAGAGRGDQYAAATHPMSNRLCLSRPSQENPAVNALAERLRQTETVVAL